jgi:hypothetical protein
MHPIFKGTKKFYPILPNSSIESSLSQRIIVEYPTIYVTRNALSPEVGEIITIPGLLRDATDEMEDGEICNQDENSTQSEAPNLDRAPPESHKEVDSSKEQDAAPKRNLENDANLAYLTQYIASAAATPEKLELLRKAIQTDLGS